MMSLKSYEYNAPTFVDFVTSDFSENDGADNFFDIGSESGGSASDNLTIVHTPQLTEPANEKIVEPLLTDVGNAVANLSIESGESTLSTTIQSKGDVKVKSNIKKIIKFTEVEKHGKRMASPIPVHQRAKFISLAEGVQHFQKDTPERFHTRSSKAAGLRHNYRRTSMVRHATVPQSPALVSQTRTRAVHYLTREQKEELELEEIRKFKLKANPVNEKILQGPPALGRKIEAKPCTKFEPFHLTTFKKKEPVFIEEPFVFAATEIPKGLFEHPLGLPELKPIPLTNAVTPAFIRHRAKGSAPVIEEKDGRRVIVEKAVCHFGVSNCATLPSKTKILPFSFEERDKLLERRKKDKLNQVFEEERKAREFHATPVPQYIRKTANMSTISILPTEAEPFNLHNGTKDSNSSKKENDSQHLPFKARPATILHKKPFEPKKSEHPLMEITAITLNTELRAKEREQFEERLKLKEAKIQAMRQELEKEEEQAAADEVARLRREAVHKANPVRRFKALEGAERIALTSPLTPKFSNRFKK